MKKIILISLLAFSTIVNAQKFRSVTSSNTAQLVNAGKTNISLFNILSKTSDTTTTYFYDSPSAPAGSDTSYIRLTVQCFPGQQAYDHSPNNPSDLIFTRNLYIRTVKGGLTVRSDSYTVSPTVSPKIEIKY